MGMSFASAQFLLQAPNTGDEHNYQWYEASDTGTILGTDSFYEATRPGVYFATYDGTLCGSNATGYFILTDCEAPNNEVILDISASVPSGATVSWSPALSGDQTRPTVTSTQTVMRYVATITKVGNSTELPRFTVVCMSQAANLVDDMIVVNEDASITVPIFDNDTDLPTTGVITTTNPSNGTITIDDNGTANDPTDDILTYTPNPDYNGSDSFDYTICNAFGDCSTATVTVDVLPIVDANDDSVSTDIGVEAVISWRANDNDIPSTGSITATDPSNGAIVLNDNGTANDPSDDNITYTPNPGFTGTDSFDYTVCDSNGNCSTATITIIVSPSGIDLDSDNDGIVDSFEDLNADNDNDPSTNPTDTDGDGIPDYLDIDSDNDGIPDNVEAQLALGYIPPSLMDANNNGLDDAYETGGNVGLIPIDSDNDGLPDYVDDDSDDDNVPDAIEGHDHDHDGVPEVTIIGSDKDNDGLDDEYEGETVIDMDVNDEMDDPNTALPDNDGDGIPDFRDSDDDDDGIETMDEDTNGDGNYANDDSNEDGTPNYLDPDLGELTVDEEEVDVVNVITPNGDGRHDTLEIRGIENFPNNTVRIYNRWGVMVYQTKAYNTTGNEFDGTSQGRVTVDQNNKLPVGTYFYVIDYENQAGTMKQLTGYIYINR
ncbi:gliding motility-associated C-terminal domain-containing protein [Muricauda sp. 334s03]|uniref:Gliding motility-associated C-terminal domain-containing protein n=1 Tax=Flagellimonas yonaguniensis TaxID=3031325 RepID=A0ABT5XWA6_9FLAO|nr:gliding motility-associated C-terminal domain-containing protein [[Muricauda] yonaguniensis]MDF0715474.1 gliding motility-associated C-terminal domain-containing protein [[Muricauda] yonaguniensis]